MGEDTKAAAAETTPAVESPATDAPAATKAEKPCLLGMGNPLLDISANVDQKFMDKYGFKLNNAILCSPKEEPCYDDLIKNYTVEYVAGGATQNSIRVAQWMLQSKPGSTDMIGCVGKDEYGKTLREAASADGVRTHYLEDESAKTGTCAVMVVDKERSLNANLAAANNYKESHLMSDAIKPVWEKASHIYSAGFFLTVSPESANAMGKHCNETGKVFAMNLSAIFIVSFFTEKLKEALKYADILFGNESEAEAWGKITGLEDLSIENIALDLAKQEKNKGGDRMVVITQGSDPTVVVKDGKVTKYPVPKIPEEEIVDTNGAGDAFVGGFLAALMSGKDIKSCCDHGCYSAGVILRASGCVVKGKPEMAL